MKDVVELAEPVFITRDEAKAGRFLDCRPGVVQRILTTRAPRVLVEGPVGSGKTKPCLERVRACCLRYPGCRWILLRSVRKWLTSTALVTWEENVVVPGELRPDRIQRANRSEYVFRNGSRVVVAGLDDSQAVMSAEYDGAFVVEATEISRETAEVIETRLRWGVMPYQQLLMDCNPTQPNHWLNLAADAGWCERIVTRHPDNPHFYRLDGTRTKAGDDYLGRMEATLTGVRRLRLLEGRWAQAEGVVYEDWDPAVHLIDPFPIPPDWEIFWAVDFGLVNPFVWQQFAIDPDGRLYLTKEIYSTGKLVEDHARMIREVTVSDRPPVDVITDHDAEGRATLERHLDVYTTPADKTIKEREGIEAVASRLRPAADGYRRLYVFKGALVNDPDPELLAVGKPTHTAAEFDGFVWKKSLLAGAKEEPVKLNNHGMDAIRYGTTWADARQRTGHIPSGASFDPDPGYTRAFSGGRPR